MEDCFEITEELMIDNLKIIQDKRYYRFTSDSVLLSRFASSKKGDIVADLCAGSGIVGLNYYGLNKPNVGKISLFELQPELCHLAEKSVAINALNEVIEVNEGRLQDVDASYNGKFTLALCNPPYKKKNSGEKTVEQHIAICRHEIEITLEEIIAAAKRLLNNRGRFCLCQRTERLSETICLLDKYGFSLSKLQLVSSLPHGAPYLFIVEAEKGVKRQLKILPQLVN